MFKKENRLKAGVGFSNSNNYSAPQFILKIKKNGLLVNRFGIVVSKKIDKRAVVRNRIKRMLRDICVKLNKNMVAGRDILFIVKKEILGKTKEENMTISESVLIKAGLIGK